MATVEHDDELIPPVLRRCEACSRKAILYVVRGKKICEECGKREVKEWNDLIKEAS